MSTDGTPVNTHAFSGNFDGQGNIIDAYYNDSSADYVSIFGYTSGANISNLTVKGNITGEAYVGSIACVGNNPTSITNCSASGLVSNPKGFLAALLVHLRAPALPTATFQVTFPAVLTI
ncbi:hypothetical protein Q5O14_02250 [Eubacteriaceae bacterium ES2]|nr:hypothetical protein Q5O14_02250 [Eubacteriaceae bacterium ES2]